MERAPAEDELENRLAALGDGLELIAARRLGSLDDGRDAAQETLVRLLARVRSGAVHGEDELLRLSYGILRHVIADILRLRAREVTAIDDLQSGGPGALDCIVREDERSVVSAALLRLSESDRLLLTRCFVEGERITTIAAALGEPAARVRKRKSRALERLARLLPIVRSEPVFATSQQVHVA
jgi:RNA polymerase sigma factor (sigma-70 family)